MAYVPPHKRHSTESPPSPTPPPESVIPYFNRNRHLKDRGSKKIIYAQDAISRWFTVGVADSDETFLGLQPEELESFDSKQGDKPLRLVVKEKPEDFPPEACSRIVELVRQDLLLAFQRVKDEMKDCETEEIKPSLVARFGRIHFRGNRMTGLGSVGGTSVSESILRKLNRTFYTNIKPSYVEYIINEVVPKTGLEFEEEKELYHVKLSDSAQPDSTISCKCIVTNESKLELRKIELNQVRHLVADISCLHRNLDLRLMLVTKGILVSLTDEETKNIKDLIDSATIDSKVKGGLRWSLGKQSSGDRYTVVGVWHTNAKTFRISSLRLKVREADRFDFKSSNGEVAREVTLKMPGVLSELLDQTDKSDLAFEMLKENIHLIEKYFLHLGSSS